MTSYYENINPQILEEISPQASRICDFGCGAGGLATAVKSTNPHVHYVGVELMEDQLTAARPTLDAAVQCNLDLLPADWDDNSDFSAKLPRASFDHVIFGDVLEHLQKPEAILKQAVLRLKPTGTVIACIPNVQHWSVFAQLAVGSWPRHDFGLFDRTHLRWFTLADMVALFEQVGLTVEKIVPRIFEAERGTEIMEYLEPLASFLGASPENLVQRGLPLQYVLVGRQNGSDAAS